MTGAMSVAGLVCKTREAHLRTTRPARITAPKAGVKIRSAHNACSHGSIAVFFQRLLEYQAIAPSDPRVGDIIHQVSHEMNA